MKPPPFRYYDPATVADAVALLGRLDNAKLLAGGQSLMPMLAMRFVLPDHVIDLNRIDDLAYIRETEGGLAIGAMTRQRDLEFSAMVRQRCPLMAEAVRQVGHRQTRNRGTLGGSLCHLDPAAELVAAAATLDAEIEIAGRAGARTVAFADFPRGYLAPAIEPDELVTAVRLPAWPAGHGWAFVEFARRHGDFAIVSAAVLLDAAPGAPIRRAAITLGGIGVAPVRVAAAERALQGQVASPALFRAAAEHCRAVEALDDVHAPSSYRQHLAAVLTRRALEQAAARLGTVP